MSNDPRLQETQPYVAPPGADYPPPKRDWFGGCLIGCLIVGAVSLLICGGVAFYAYRNVPNLVFQGAREVLSSTLEQSQLPEDEQAAILEQFDRVGTGYLEGELTLDEVGQIIEELAESPMMSVIFLQIVDAVHLEKSGLSDDEKVEARVTLQRFFRGAMDDRFEQEELDSIMDQIRKNPNATDSQDQQEIKSSFTDEELRQVLQDAKELCDLKEIPVQDTEVVISEEMKEVIDKRLGQ